MRVKLLRAVALATVILMPKAGEASSITGTSATPDSATAGHAAESEPSSGEPTLWADPSLSSLFDESGDPLLQISPSNTFQRFGDLGKLRSWQESDGCALGCSGSGGSGSSGGLNFTPLGFTFSPESLFQSDLNLNLNLDLNLDLDLNLPGDECCDCNECGGGGGGQTVPEPSLFVLAASGLAIGIRRVMR